MRSKDEIMSDEGSNIAGEKTNIESEPRVCAADEDLEVCPFTVVIGKVLPRGLGGFDTLNLGVWVDVEGTGLEEVIDILGCLVDIALDIHSETRCFGDGETEVESDNTRDTSKTDEDTPHGVNRVELCGAIGKKGGLVGSDNDEGDNGSSKLSPTLVGKDSGHETTTEMGC